MKCATKADQGVQGDSLTFLFGCRTLRGLIRGPCTHALLPRVVEVARAGCSACRRDHSVPIADHEECTALIRGRLSGVDCDLGA